ncbi:hypothetical protein B0H66DRAFT_295583 [Apodospora peruviana]|uniref:Uncharacterized protein n=1 Tax=Apodospora peruviana TaxID=516989 RepID=A0AAE0I0W6_9PEZI|nr:hypothetical protein B0H66DRAFT_295583 [Apodospora peruviana]
MGACTQTLEGHLGLVNSVASSLNSKQITSGSDDANSSHFQGYGIGSDNRWIMRGLENWLWLPPEYRPGSSAVAGSIVAIGCLSGRVLTMTLTTAKLICASLFLFFS